MEKITLLLSLLNVSSCSFWLLSPNTFEEDGRLPFRVWFQCICCLVTGMCCFFFFFVNCMTPFWWSGLTCTGCSSFLLIISDVLQLRIHNSNCIIFCIFIVNCWCVYLKIYTCFYVYKYLCIRELIILIHWYKNKITVRFYYASQFNNIIMSCSY